MTVIALDDRDHGMVLRVFEQLTGLHEGTLVAPPDLVNRSMTMPEVEAVRAFNIAFKAEGLGRDLHSKVMGFGAAPFMRLRTPDPSEPQVESPQWALDRVAVIAREMVDHIAASGVRVVGDLDALAQASTGATEEDGPTAVSIPPEIAARMSLGIALASGAGRASGTRGSARNTTPGERRLPAALPEPGAVSRMSTYVVAAVVAVRVRDALVRRIDRQRLRRPRWPWPSPVIPRRR